jgi:hypothetical protein
MAPLESRPGGSGPDTTERTALAVVAWAWVSASNRCRASDSSRSLPFVLAPWSCRPTPRLRTFDVVRRHRTRPIRHTRCTSRLLCGVRMDLRRGRGARFRSRRISVCRRGRRGLSTLWLTSRSLRRRVSVSRSCVGLFDDLAAEEVRELTWPSLWRCLSWPGVGVGVGVS